jgi:predicted nucleotidyltransferase
MITLEQIQNLTDDIVRHFHPDKVILFGSFAYGTPGPASDADLLVVMPFEGHPLEKMAEIVDEVHPKIAIDLLVRTPDMINHRLNLGDRFTRDILDKGKVLYERANA